jgi:hypothetical protein
MGRKKKKTAKPWCWYCNREFDDEKILIQHQKAKHFKCHICNKKLFTGPGLAIHCMQVHKETIDKIPAAIPGRDSMEIEVYGMEGIPPEDDEPRAKRAALPSSIPTPAMPPGMSPAGPYGMMMPPYGVPMPSYMPTGVPMPTGPVPIPLPTRPPTTASIPVPPMSIPMPPIIAQPQPPPSATFPAYQNVAKQESVEVGSSGGVNLNGNGDNAGGAVKPLTSRTKIVCPDENISLEERMAARVEAMSRNTYR